MNSELFNNLDGSWPDLVHNEEMKISSFVLLSVTACGGSASTDVFASLQLLDAGSPLGASPSLDAGKNAPKDAETDAASLSNNPLDVRIDRDAQVIWLDAGLGSAWVADPSATPICGNYITTDPYIAPYSFTHTICAYSDTDYVVCEPGCAPDGGLYFNLSGGNMPSGLCVAIPDGSTACLPSAP